MPPEANDQAPKKYLKRATLRYPDYAFKPEDLLDFIELPPFSRRWNELGLDAEDDLTALQLTIMTDPRIGKAIQGTHGIRKMRYAPSRWNSGKSGGVRVLYIYFEEFGIVLLCLVYGKGEVDNISNAVKKYLNQLVAEIERELRRGNSR